MDKLTKDLEEVKKLHAEATRQRIKDVLAIEQYKIEQEIQNLEMKERVIEQEPNKAAGSNAANKIYHIELQEYAWDQSDKFVKIFITLPGVHTLPEDAVVADFTGTSLLVRIENLNQKNYSLTIKKLHSDIDTAKSYRKVKTDMVAIYMKKLEENQNWSHLTMTEKRVSQIKESKLKDSTSDLKDDPSAGIMNLMKKMYESGDSETKKMIAKAWTESQEKQQKGMPI